jgi:ABC-2 type transport system ATP-binding protein
MLLDEPANGLDPAGIRFLRELLRNLSHSGITVFLSSHLLAEVQELCERVAIIVAGRIAYEGSLAELRARTGRRYRLSVSDRPRAIALCRATRGVTDIKPVGEQVEFAVADDDALLEATRALVEAGLVIHALMPEQLTLERVFFELTESPSELRSRPQEVVS